MSVNLSRVMRRSRALAFFLIACTSAPVLVCADDTELPYLPLTAADYKTGAPRACLKPSPPGIEWPIDRALVPGTSNKTSAQDTASMAKWASECGPYFFEPAHLRQELPRLLNSTWRVGSFDSFICKGPVTTDFALMFLGATAASNFALNNGTFENTLFDIFLEMSLKSNTDTESCITNGDASKCDSQVNEHGHARRHAYVCMLTTGR